MRHEPGHPIAAASTSTSPQRIHDNGERRLLLPLAWVVQIVAGKVRRPVIQDLDKLPGGQRPLHHVFGSGVPREEIFLETKIWINDFGYDETLHGFEKATRKLGVDQLDLLILHQALPSAFDRTIGAYRALEQLLADGQVRAIGVSNFMPEHIERLLAEVDIVPAVNQIEVHPFFQQAELQRVHQQHGILTQAWSPIGGITFYRGSGKSSLEDPTILEIARAHGKSAAQVMLRWGLQHGRSVIPKSVKPARIAENFDVFDFVLTPAQLAAIDALETGVRGGPAPEVVTLETFSRPIPEA